METGPRIEKSAINSSNLLQASNSRVFLSNRRRTTYSFQFLHDQNQPKFEQVPSLSLSRRRRPCKSIGMYDPPPGVNSIYRRCSSTILFGPALVAICKRRPLFYVFLSHET